MDQELDSMFGFAPEHDSPIPYMRRTRDYYKAIGYTTPYRWAHYLQAPFTPMTKPLSQCNVAIITTAAPYQPGKGDQGPGAAYNGSAKFYQVYSGDTNGDHDLRISHIGYDRIHTDGDRQQFLVSAAGVAPRRRGGQNRAGRATLPWRADQSQPSRHDRNGCAGIAGARARADGVDAVIVVPNCPVCHQTSSLVARHIEANGIPTVLMGCAKDIVEHAAVARFLFSDFPLGNSAGKPHDVASQDQTLELALRLLESATGPQTTMQNPQRWNADGLWKLDFSNVDQLSAEELKRRRAEFDRQKELARVNRVEKAA